MSDTRSDADLVALAKSGDEDAFGELVVRYRPMAERIAVRVVAEREVARELAQEAILQAYLSLDRLRDAGRFQSWLYGIVLNVCRSYYRGRRHASNSLEILSERGHESPMEAADPDPHGIAETKELHELVRHAVQALTPKNRAATLLFYYEHLNVQEIATLLGVSVTAVKGRLHKSRDRVRRELLRSNPEMRTPIPRMVGKRRCASLSRGRPSGRRRGRRRSGMAEVVSSQMATCPSCAVQALIRVWSCGCQGTSYPDHQASCEMPDDYFDVFIRHCQELQERGKNPQVHLRLVSGE